MNTKTALPPSTLRENRMAGDFLGEILATGIGVFEIRGFECDIGKNGWIIPVDKFQRTVVGWFDRVDKAVAKLGRLRGVSPYVTLNPVRPERLAHGNNRLRISTDRIGASSDIDVVCLRWMYLDLDPCRLSYISSTDDELKAAVERRDRILTENPDLMQCSLWGRSGNGAWILIRLPDYPNEPTFNALVAHAHRHIVERYSDDVADVDKTTKNPSRVMCVPGCFKIKGDEIPGRPYRPATFDGRGSSA